MRWLLQLADAHSITVVQLLLHLLLLAAESNRYNIPATADPESEANPWNILRKIATPKDYVVVKLDIDNTLVEEQFIAQLRASSDLHNLIDEFYFEHHVNVSVEHSQRL
jgi:hypothetical protein